MNGRHVIEIAIGGLQPPPMFFEERDRVGVRRRWPASAGAERQVIVDLEIGREENAILMLVEEASHPGRIVPSNLGNARREIRHHVGVSIEGLFHPIEILGVVGKMHANEGGLGMPRDDAVERLEKGFARRVDFLVAEPPVLVILSSVQRSLVESYGSQNARGSAT